MKRLHVHVAVKDFATEPSVRKPDYAKWMLEDPRVNFAVSDRSERGVPSGVDHLGIQVEDRAELREVYGRLKKAEAPVIEEGEKTCCYAQSEKSWIQDPQGVQWEAFLTTGESTVYGTDEIRSVEEKKKAEASCCAPSCSSPEAV